MLVEDTTTANTPTCIQRPSSNQAHRDCVWLGIAIPGGENRPLQVATPMIYRGSRVGRSPVRVHVDAERCQGHNRCYALAPELFDIDEEGNAHELNDGVVPTDLEEKARLAVANCPEYAISITE
jgi:ferredoxin